MTTRQRSRPRPERLDPALLKLAAILVTGAIAPLLDSTIVNVAIGTLGRDLHTSVSTIQWVITAYLLALAMAIPVTGWTVRRFGAKRMWLISLLLFLAGSVLCGTAWSAGSLIAFRVPQGIGGGLMLPIMQTLLMQASGGRRLGRLMATISLPALIGPILGPVLGGLIVGNLSWRWIFFVNVPICVLALTWAWRALPADPPGGRRHLDVLGLALLSPGLAAIIYGLSQVGGHNGFDHGIVVAPLAIGLTLLTAFAFHALRTVDEPAIDLRLFRIRSFAASSALLFLSGLSMYGAMLLLPLFYQQVRNQGVIAAGLLLAPQGLGSLLSRGPLGALTDRIGARPIVLTGLILTTLGTFPYTQSGPHTSNLLLSISLVVRGAGLSAANLAVMAAAFQGLTRDQIPHASSTTRIMQQLGGSFGAAVLAAILETQLAGHSTAAAYDRTFWWSLAFTAMAVVPALFLPRHRRPSK